MPFTYCSVTQAQLTHLHLLSAQVQFAVGIEHTHLVHIISSDDWMLGNSVSWLSARLSFLRFIRPHGITDGRETRQLAERSSSVI